MIDKKFSNIVKERIFSNMLPFQMMRQGDLTFPSLLPPFLMPSSSKTLGLTTPEEKGQFELGHYKLCC